MEEHGDCMSGACPGVSADGATISIYVPHHHPLLQLKRALPWDALFEVMGRHWRRAGKNTDGRPGLPWDMALYVPLVVLMLVKRLNTREMEAYVSENDVARVFIGCQDDPSPQPAAEQPLASQGHFRTFRLRCMLSLVNGQMAQKWAFMGSSEP